MGHISTILYGFGIGVVGVLAGIIIHRVLFVFFDWFLDKLEEMDEDDL